MVVSRALSGALGIAIGVSLLSVPGAASAAADDRAALEEALASTLVLHNEGVVSESVAYVSGELVSSSTSGMVGSDLSAGVAGLDVFWSVDTDAPEPDTRPMVVLPSGGKAVFYERLSDLSSGWPARVRKIVYAEVESLGGSGASLVPGRAVHVSYDNFRYYFAAQADPAVTIAIVLSDEPGIEVSSAPGADGGTVFTVIDPGASKDGFTGVLTVPVDAAGVVSGFSYASDEIVTETVVTSYGATVQAPDFTANRVDTAYPRLGEEFSSARWSLSASVSTARASITARVSESESKRVTKKVIRAGLRDAGALENPAFRVRQTREGYAVSAVLSPKARELFGSLCTSFAPAKKDPGVLAVESC